MLQTFSKHMISTVSASCLALVSCLLSIDPAQAFTLHTTDFIPDITRVNFNGFEALPDSSYNSSVYVEDGIKVEQANGINNIVSAGFFGFEGSKSWYPNGGDYGYTKITRADGGDFVNIGLLGASGFGGSSTYVYQLLKNEFSVFSGTIFEAGNKTRYFGFSGGIFNEVRLGNYYGDNLTQVLSGYNALAIDNIELSGFTQPEQSVPTPALLPGLIGLGMSALRRRKQLEAATVSEQG